jgi:uncharacterized protein YdeI (YjbR/CyaY-like superfamily)
MSVIMANKHTSSSRDLPMLEFKDQQAFEVWITKHHPESHGVWIRMYKKASGIPSITYAEAVEVALCYGWIDSQMKSYDESSYIQKFTPRKSKSPWSEINKGHVARLIKEGRMREPGLAAIEIAKQNGQWDSAYASPSNTVPSPEFQQALNVNKKAKEFFKTLSKTQQFYFIYWINGAKRSETKEKRIKESIGMLERREKRN